MFTARLIKYVTPEFIKDVSVHAGLTAIFLNMV